MTFAERYGPWAVIAGASDGTGSAFARKIAAKGINCILIARRGGLLKSLADELCSEHGIECVTASIDLAAPDAWDEMAAAIGDREVGLYISNAGGDPNNALFLDNDIANWDALVARNVVTLVRSLHHFAATMKPRGRGGIIIVGSGAAYCAGSYLTTYSATKAFGLNIGEGLWTELKPHGIHVLNLMLVQTDTPAIRELLERGGRPIPTDMASPDDVAEVGLAELPNGPTYNWGLAEDEVGYATTSAAARRRHVLWVNEQTTTYMGH